MNMLIKILIELLIELSMDLISLVLMLSWPELFIFQLFNNFLDFLGVSWSHKEGIWMFLDFIKVI